MISMPCEIDALLCCSSSHFLSYYCSSLASRLEPEVERSMIDHVDVCWIDIFHQTFAVSETSKTLITRFVWLVLSLQNNESAHILYSVYIQLCIIYKKIWIWKNECIEYTALIYSSVEYWWPCLAIEYALLKAWLVWFGVLKAWLVCFGGGFFLIDFIPLIGLDCGWCL